MFKKWVLFTILASSSMTLNLKSSHAAAGPMDVSGVYYQKIVHMKDVIADILPPPAYIIESYLVALQMYDAVEAGAPKKVLEDLISYGEKLANGRSDKGDPFPGYNGRIEYWLKDLDSSHPVNGPLKALLTEKSAPPAKKFFQIRDSKLIPALKGGNLAEAAKIIRTELKPAYDEHRKVVDKIVIDANTEYVKVEKAAIDRLGKGEQSPELRIKGKEYNQIIRMKDLIADILPPPAYIIEALLISMQMIDDVDENNGKISEAFEKHTAYGKLLKDGNSSKGEAAGYLERIEYWKKNLSDKTTPEKKTKDLMTSLSVNPALKFFAIRDDKLIPALRAGKIPEAKAILRSELKPAYDEHRKFIDELVARANKVYAQLEAEVAQQLANK